MVRSMAGCRLTWCTSVGTWEGTILATLLSGIDSPLEVYVQKLAAEAQRIARDAGVEPLAFTQDAGGFIQDTAAGAPSGGATGFSQDVTQGETAVNAAATELPKFISKYRNLNLLLAGVTMTSKMPAQIAELQKSFQKLKGLRDPKADTAAVKDMQTKVMDLYQMMRMAFQKRGAPAAGTFKQ